MKALILSCSTGGGHNSAGAAVAQEIRKHGHNADIVNLSSLDSPTSSDISKNFYVFVVKHFPYAFGAVYYLAKAISTTKINSPVYAVNSLSCKKLDDFISSKDYDIIVTTHLFAAQRLTHLKRTGKLNIPFIFILTDYTCSPFHEEPESDYTVIPHIDCAAECIKRGIKPDRIAPLGIPVQESYSVKTEKQEARRLLGLPENETIFLVMSGSMGFGNLLGFVKMLDSRCTNGEHIVIICGTDKTAFDKLNAEYICSPDNRIHITGYTDKVSLYMDACDIIFSKPGGLSSTEAAAKRIPIVHMSEIPGCETANMKFFRQKGMSLTGRNNNERIDAGFRIISDKQIRKKMIQAQEKNINPQSANKIYQLLLHILNEGEIK